MRRFEHQVARAHSKDSMKALTKLAAQGQRRFRIVSDPPLVVPIHDLAREEGVDNDCDQLGDWLREQFRLYRRSLRPSQRRLLESYRLVDFARKVVGVGSVGTRCWIALLDWARTTPTRCSSRSRKPNTPCSSAMRARAHTREEGRRVVEGQLLLRSQATFSWAGSGLRALDGIERDFTSASCGTGRCRQTSKRSRRKPCRVRRNVRWDARPRTLGRRRRRCRVPRIQRRVRSRRRRLRRRLMPIRTNATSSAPPPRRSVMIPTKTQ